MKLENPDQFKTTSKAVDEPELSVGAREYVSMFYRLTGSRPVGMGVGAIPMSELLIYADYAEIDDTEMYLDIILSADATYLKLYNEDQKVKNK